MYVYLAAYMYFCNIPLIDCYMYVYFCVNFFSDLKDSLAGPVIDC